MPDSTNEPQLSQTTNQTHDTGRNRIWNCLLSCFSFFRRPPTSTMEDSDTFHQTEPVAEVVSISMPESHITSVEVILEGDVEEQQTPRISVPVQASDEHAPCTSKKSVPPMRIISGEINVSGNVVVLPPIPTMSVPMQGPNILYAYTYASSLEQNTTVTPDVEVVPPIPTMSVPVQGPNILYICASSLEQNTTNISVTSNAEVVPPIPIISVPVQGPNILYTCTSSPEQNTQNISVTPNAEVVLPIPTISVTPIPTISVPMQEQNILYPYLCGSRLDLSTANTSVTLAVPMQEPNILYPGASSLEQNTTDT